jgi:hypothetical protein
VILVGTDNEIIEYKIEKASTTTGLVSAERKYDLLFTNNGIAMLLVEGAVKMGIGGFGAADVVINKVMRDEKIEKQRSGYSGLSVQDMLRKNEKNVYFPYSDVKSVSLKKSLVGCTLALEAGEQKYKCTFSGSQMDIANKAISSHLTAKLK